MMLSPGGDGPVGEGLTSGMVVRRCPGRAAALGAGARSAAPLRCWRATLGAKRWLLAKDSLVQIALAARRLKLESWGREGVSGCCWRGRSACATKIILSVTVILARLARIAIIDKADMRAPRRRYAGCSAASPR